MSITEIKPKKNKDKRDLAVLRTSYENICSKITSTTTLNYTRSQNKERKPNEHM